MRENRLIVVIGAGGHASSVADAAISSGFRVVGFVGGAPVRFLEFAAHTIDYVAEIDLDRVELCLGIGTNFLREQLFLKIMTSFPQARFPPISHRTAWVSPDATEGAGSVLLAHTTLGPKAELGIGALLNTSASLDHDSKLGDFGSLGPGARTGGGVVIGERTMVGMQAGILQGVRVGSDVVIGAQSLATADIPNLSVAAGSPCRTVRERMPREPYY